jgi:glucose-6-phosphate 1-dehydrogenase
MDPPGSHAPDGFRDEKGKVKWAIHPLSPQDLVRGQFVGYRQEPGVAPDSQVETFAAVRLFIDSWRWADVPFYIRAGKELPVTCTEVFVQFYRPPQRYFGNLELAQANSYVRFRLSPDVVTAIGARAKKPGEELRGEDVELQVSRESAGDIDPYERLLAAAIAGDSTLFSREDGVEAAWRVVDPILQEPTPLYPYEPGTWGPPQADTLVQSIGGWHNPTKDG